MDADVLTSARDAYGRRAWTEAHALFARADGVAPLPPADLECLAVAAYMAGRDDQQLEALVRAHEGHLRAGDRPRAARVAFWIGVHLLLLGEPARASGWHARTRRLVQGEPGDCVERGYVASADALRHMSRRRLARDPRRVAGGHRRRRALRRPGPGRARAHRPRARPDRGGQVEEGLGRLDEAMVAAVAGERRPS